MGNIPSGVLIFTLYQRNTPPVVWLCGATGGQSAGAFHTATLDLSSPFGAGSESDVLISGLTIRPSAEQGSFSVLSVRGTFDGTYPIAAELQVAMPGRNRTNGVYHTSWTKAFPGPNGQRVLMIEVRDAQVELPYGEQMAVSQS